MLQKLKTMFIGAALMFGVVAIPLATAPVAHAVANSQVCKGINSIDPDGGTSGTSCDGGGKLSTFLQQIINILLFIIGSIAVLMIIIGGLRYVLSAGDQNAVTGAKNTILYSVVGLIVAIMAFAIVNFVVAKL